jgi:hypothetical protein
MPKEWLRRIAPYAAMTLRILRYAIPVTGALLALDNGQLADANKELDLAAALVDACPEFADARVPSADTGDPTTADGPALRALRELLNAEDPQRRFGDLHRTVTASGDFRWICPDHSPLGHLYRCNFTDLIAGTWPGQPRSRYIDHMIPALDQRQR